MKNKIRNDSEMSTIFLRRMVRWMMGEYNFSSMVPIRFNDGMETKAFMRVIADSVRVWIAPIRTTDGPNAGRHSPGRVFNIIAHLGSVMKPSTVPAGDLGIYRQPILARFTEEQEKLLAEWGKGIKPPDPDAKKKARLKRAEDMVSKWVARNKLANTKLKIWNRRVRAARKALGK